MDGFTDRGQKELPLPWTSLPLTTDPTEARGPLRKGIHKGHPEWGDRGLQSHLSQSRMKGASRASVVGVWGLEPRGVRAQTNPISRPSRMKHFP